MKQLRYILYTACFVGFIYQTLSFLFLYWTYPVVVDIQTTAPFEFPMPAITFCNGNGIKPQVFCDMKARCTGSRMLKFTSPCGRYPTICAKLGYKIPDDMQFVRYNELLKRKDLSPTELKNLKKPVDDFFSCKIVSSSGERNCGTNDTLVGSYYSDSYFFSICYTINSRWSQPNKILETVKRSDRLKIEFYVDTIDRDRHAPLDTVVRPKFNYPSLESSTQMIVHNNDVSMSPTKNGVEFLGGKHYQIKLTQEEKHLLPAPYQTNCTDYVTAWRDRGGVGPLNPIMAVEECKYNFSLKMFGCVPLNVDYSHNNSVCKSSTNSSSILDIANLCEKLLERYTQPCDSVTYKMKLEEKTILIEKKIENNITNSTESIFHSHKGYDCADIAVLTRRCQIIHVDIMFNDFEKTTITYKPKLETLELLSIIGGSMGIYLGISMISVFKLLSYLMAVVYRKKRSKRENKNMKTKSCYKGKQSDPHILRGMRSRTRVHVLKE